MASLYKKPVMVTDPATGQKVKDQSRKWWGQYKDAHEQLKRVPLSIDKTAAQAMLNQLVQRELVGVHVGDVADFGSDREVVPIRSEPFGTW